MQRKVNPKGYVLADGDRWTAVIDRESAEAGDEVKVFKVEALKLTVNRKGNVKED